MKSKKEIINEISEEMRISKKKATELFHKAMENGDIKRIYDWKKIVDISVITLVIIAMICAAIRVAKNF